MQWRERQRKHIKGTILYEEIFMKESLWRNLCLIRISNSVSDQPTKVSVLNIQRAAVLVGIFKRTPKRYQDPCFVGVV